MFFNIFNVPLVNYRKLVHIIINIFHTLNPNWNGLIQVKSLKLDKFKLLESGSKLLFDVTIELTKVEDIIGKESSNPEQAEKTKAPNPNERVFNRWYDISYPHKID